MDRGFDESHPLRSYEPLDEDAQYVHRQEYRPQEYQPQEYAHPEDPVSSPPVSSHPNPVHQTDIFSPCFTAAMNLPTISPRRRLRFPIPFARPQPPPGSPDSTLKTPRKWPT